MTLTPNLIACLAIGGAGILTALLSIPLFRRQESPAALLCPDRGNCDTLSLPAKQSGGPSIAPVAAFQVNGVGYLPVSTIRVRRPFPNRRSFSGTIPTENLHCRAERHLSRPAGVSSPEHGGNGTETWQPGSKLPVVYDRTTPGCAYIDHVVSKASVAGITLLCVGAGLAGLAMLGAGLFHNR
ncbi:MAG: hypothetical protein ACLUOF_03275 [Ruminococcus sp.]